MSRLRNLAVAGFAALAMTVTAACGAVSNDSDKPAGTDGATGGFQTAQYIKDHVKNGDKLQIRLSYHDPSLAFAVPIKQGMEKAAGELGVDAQLIGPTGGDAAKQVAELQTLINQKKVDAIAVSSASNDALKPVIEQAYNAGIPIISFNTNNTDSKQMAFVGQDLVASGKGLGDEMQKVLGDEKGKIVVVSVDSGAGWSNDRFKGFSESVKDKGYEIVGPVNTGNEPSAAYNAIESTMGGHKDAIAMASLDCCSFPAAAKWVEQSGNKGKIKVFGFDVQPQTVGFVKNEVASFTISQAPADQGYQAVRILTEYLKNGTEIKDVDTGIQLITKANIDDVPVEG